jgi:hypothetical protein
VAANAEVTLLQRGQGGIPCSALFHDTAQVCQKEAATRVVYFLRGLQNLYGFGLEAIRDDAIDVHKRLAGFKIFGVHHGFFTSR